MVVKNVSILQFLYGVLREINAPKKFWQACGNARPQKIKCSTQFVNASQTHMNRCGAYYHIRPVTYVCISQTHTTWQRDIKGGVLN